MKSRTQFCDRLDALMTAKRLNNSQLAAMIWGRRINNAGKNDAIGKDRISVWRRGISEPSPKSLAKLAKALKVKAEDLMPQAEMKAAFKGPIDWMFSKPPNGPNGKIFVQVAQFVPDDIALQLHALLVKDAAR